MKKVVIMTSGGDAPGMNACLRSLVRVILSKSYEAWGVFRAYDGLIDDDIRDLHHQDVSNIIQLGGTILKTSRSPRFLTSEGMKKAALHLKKRKIDALIALGGDGTMKGLDAFSDYWDGQLIGIPATIDNDLYGSDETIGYDSATNIAVQAIDKIRDTAGAHERNFIVEVMGRSSGHIALSVGVASGAEEILIPERDSSLDEIVSNMNLFLKKGKSSQIIVVAEKDGCNAGIDLAQRLKSSYGLEYKVSILGYIQRGGSPTVKDRLLAAQLAAFSVSVMDRGESCIMVGQKGGDFVTSPLKEVFSQKKPCDSFLYDLSKILR